MAAPKEITSLKNEFLNEARQSCKDISEDQRKKIVLSLLRGLVREGRLDASESVKH